MRTLEFYTDGAFSSKSEMGGWASICIEEETVIDVQYGNEPFSTNNRMELTAFLTALETINTIESRYVNVTIYTDSAYISNCINEKWYLKWLSNGWKTSDKQDVKNQDIWSRILALYIKLKSKISGLQVVKLKSHNGNKWNNYVDVLAVRARKELEE